MIIAEERGRFTQRIDPFLDGFSLCMHALFFLTEVNQLRRLGKEIEHDRLWQTAHLLAFSLSTAADYS